MDGFVRSVELDPADGLLHRARCCRSPTRSRARSRSPTAGSARRRARRIPNRRFLMAGTAYGSIATDVDEPGRSPRRPTARSSTACTRTGSAGATTSPTSRRPRSSRRSSRSTRQPRTDRRTSSTTAPRATLPVGELRRSRGRRGLADRHGAQLACPAPRPRHRPKLDSDGGDEEAPQDIYYGEAWAHRVVEAVLQLTGLAAHAAHLHLRRARRLLRPRAAARRRSRPTRSRRN